MDGYFALGLLLALAACTSVYLSASHQCWRARPWPARPARTAGSLLLACSLAAFLQAMQAVAAVFVFVTWVMLLLVLFPYLGAFLALHRSR